MCQLYLLCELVSSACQQGLLGTRSRPSPVYIRTRLTQLHASSLVSPRTVSLYTPFLWTLLATCVFASRRQLALVKLEAFDRQCVWCVSATSQDDEGPIFRGRYYAHTFAATVATTSGCVIHKGASESLHWALPYEAAFPWSHFPRHPRH